MAEPQGPPRESQRDRGEGPPLWGRQRKSAGGQTTHVHGLTALEAGRPRSRCPAGLLALGLSVIVSSSFLCPHISRVVIPHLVCLCPNLFFFFFKILDYIYFN